LKERTEHIEGSAGRVEGGRRKVEEAVRRGGRSCGRDNRDLTLAAEALHRGCCIALLATGP
jgi:general stress protein YciG